MKKFYLSLLIILSTTLVCISQVKTSPKPKIPQKKLNPTFCVQPKPKVIAKKYLSNDSVKVTIQWEAIEGVIQYNYLLFEGVSINDDNLPIFRGGSTRNTQITLTLPINSLFTFKLNSQCSPRSDQLSIPKVLLIPTKKPIVEDQVSFLKNPNEELKCTKNVEEAVGDQFCENVVLTEGLSHYFTSQYSGTTSEIIFSVEKNNTKTDLAYMYQGTEGNVLNVTRQDDTHLTFSILNSGVLIYDIKVSYGVGQDVVAKICYYQDATHIYSTCEKPITSSTSSLKLKNRSLKKKQNK